MTRARLVITVLLLAACAGRGSVYSGPTGPEAVAALYERIGMHGETPAAVRRSLGEPQRVERDTVANRHGYGTDTTITMLHRGWRHDFLALGASGTVILTGRETIDGAVGFPAGLRIGLTTASQLRARLGAPHDTDTVADTTVLSWRHPAMEADSYVELAVVRDTVRMVRWVPYVD